MINSLWNRDILIIFIHGKSSRFIQKILKILSNSEQKHEWWAWLDNDLGGIEIFQFIEKLIAPYLISPIIPFQSETIPYRVVSRKNRQEISKRLENGSMAIQKFGTQILNQGKIEQEIFHKRLYNNFKIIFKINIIEVNWY